MRDPTLCFQTGHKIHNQVLGDGLVAVREDEVHVAAELLAAAVAADDDALDAAAVVGRVRADAVRVPGDGGGD